MPGRRKRQIETPSQLIGAGCLEPSGPGPAGVHDEDVDRPQARDDLLRGRPYGRRIGYVEGNRYGARADRPDYLIEGAGPAGRDGHPGSLPPEGLRARPP